MLWGPNSSTDPHSEQVVLACNSHVTSFFYLYPRLPLQCGPGGSTRRSWKSMPVSNRALERRRSHGSWKAQSHRHLRPYLDMLLRNQVAAREIGFFPRISKIMMKAIAMVMRMMMMSG